MAVVRKLKQPLLPDHASHSTNWFSPATPVDELTREHLQGAAHFLQSLPPSAETAKFLLSLARVAMTAGSQMAAAAHLREASPMVAAWQRFTDHALSLVTRATAYQAEPHGDRDPSWQHKIDASMAEIGTQSVSDTSTSTRSDASCRKGKLLNTDADPAESARKPGRNAEPTQREQDVARLLAAGLSNRQIARRLTLSERTVESHLANLRKKLGLQSRAQVAIWAAHRAT